MFSVYPGAPPLPLEVHEMILGGRWTIVLSYIFVSLAYQTSNVYEYYYLEVTWVLNFFFFKASQHKVLSK